MKNLAYLTNLIHFSNRSRLTKLVLVFLTLALLTTFGHTKVLAQSADFFKAAQSNDTAKLKSMLNSGTDVNLKHSGGNTALHYASGHENAAAVKLLIAHGANVNSANPEGTMPFHYAIYYGRVGTIEYLIAHGAVLNTPHPDGKPSDLAEKVGQSDISLLMSAYQNPSASTTMIYKAQERLKSLGFDCGTIDGNIGPATIISSQNFQRKFHYSVDATITANTIAQISI